MLRKRRIILNMAGLSLFLLAILCLRPVPRLTDKNAITVTTIIKSVFEGGEKDIVFTTYGSDEVYYINRGLEQDLDIAQLRERLVGEEVVIVYPKYWSPLDAKQKVKHLSKLLHQDDLIYDETSLY